jgi:integrase
LQSPLLEIDVSQIIVDESGDPRFHKNRKPLLRGKDSLPALRHFFCSWLIERGKPLKEVQTQMGHSSATMKLDRYGHLFPRADDAAELC